MCVLKIVKFVIKIKPVIPVTLIISYLKMLLNAFHQRIILKIVKLVTQIKPVIHVSLIISYIKMLLNAINQGKVKKIANPQIWMDYATNAKIIIT